MNKKGQGAFIGLIMVLAGIIIFILALPWINLFISHGVANSGTASGFMIRLFPWVILLLLFFAAYKAIARGSNE